VQGGYFFISAAMRFRKAWLHRKKRAFGTIIKTAHAPILLGSQAQAHHNQPEEKNLYHYHQNRVI